MAERLLPCYLLYRLLVFVMESVVRVTGHSLVIFLLLTSQLFYLLFVEANHTTQWYTNLLCKSFDVSYLKNCLPEMEKSV